MILVAPRWSRCAVERTVPSKRASSPLRSPHLDDAAAATTHPSRGRIVSAPGATGDRASPQNAGDRDRDRAQSPALGPRATASRRYPTTRAGPEGCERSHRQSRRPDAACTAALGEWLRSSVPQRARSRAGHHVRAHAIGTTPDPGTRRTPGLKPGLDCGRLLLLQRSYNAPRWCATA